MAHRRRINRSPRRGVLALELLLIFPILLVLVLALVQFGMTLHARQQLVAASREGCRVAAVGGTPEQVALVVRRCLGDGRLGQAQALLTDAWGQPMTTPLDVPSGELIQVWVRVSTSRVIPDLLSFIGISHRHEELVGRTTMRRE